MQSVEHEVDSRLLVLLEVPCDPEHIEKGMATDLHAAAKLRKDAGRFSAPGILWAQCEQVVDVLCLEEALLPGILQHLDNADTT